MTEVEMDIGIGLQEEQARPWSPVGHPFHLPDQLAGTGPLPLVAGHVIVVPAAGNTLVTGLPGRGPYQLRVVVSHGQPLRRLWRLPPARSSAARAA